MPYSTPVPLAELTFQQLNAIDLLASGVGVIKTAEALGINRHTIKRWKKSNPFFIAQLNATRKEQWSEAHERLRGMVTKSLDILEDALNSGDSKTAVDVLKAVKLYGNVPAPHGSSSVDAVMTEMAKQYAKELLYGQPIGDSQSQALYGSRMLPILTAEVFEDMKENINKYIGDDDDDHVDTPPRIK